MPPNRDSEGLRHRGGNRLSLGQLFVRFLKLGCIAFGGPAAHVGLMERELVSRQQWLTPQVFLDFVGSVNLIPGPNSTQLTMLAGYSLRGFPGMIAAGCGFLLPAALITGLLAWFYVRMGQVPAIEALFFGIKPAVIAVIAGAVVELGRRALKNIGLGVLGALTLAATLLGASEITAILGAGLLGMGLYAGWRIIGPGSGEQGPPDRQKGRAGGPRDKGRGGAGNGTARSLLPAVWLGPAAGAVASYHLPVLFWVFFKIGALLFGTGYVLVAYMDGELVEKLGWLTRTELLDAIAIGQFTPGPILSAATFVGYLLDGPTGAIVATLGIFLPSVLFIVLLYPLIPKLRRSPYTSAFLDSVNVAAVAVMASVTLRMSVQVLNIPAGFDVRAALILALALGVVIGLKKIGSAWIILGGAILGYLIG